MDPWTCAACGGKNRVGLSHCLRCGKPAPPVMTPASLHAQRFVENALKGPFFSSFPEVLDFTPASLARLDVMLNELFGVDGLAPGVPNWQPPGRTLQSVIDFGAYLGEVLCRALPAQWQMHAQFPDAVLQARVLDAQGRAINPFAQVAMRFRDGATQPVAVIYTALSGRALPAWQMPASMALTAKPVPVPSAPAPASATNPSPPFAVSPQEALANARHHLERGHQANAIRALHSLAQVALNSAQRAERAALSVQVEDFDTALSDFRQLMAEQDHDPTWPEQIALVLARVGKLDLALSEMDAALKRFPNHAGLVRRQAFLLLKAERYESAELSIMKLLRSTPDDPDLLLGMAEAQIQQKRVDEAALSLQKLLQSGQGSVQQRQAATEKLQRLRSGRSSTPEPVRAQPQSSVASSPAGTGVPAPEQISSAPEAYDRAIEFARSKRFNEALPWFKRAVTLQPNNATYWKDLGQCTKDCGYPESGRAFLGRALSLDPNYTLVRYLIGQCFEAEQRIDEAVARYQAVLADPRSDQRWVDRSFDRLKALGRI